MSTPTTFVLTREVRDGRVALARAVITRATRRPSDFVPVPYDEETMPWPDMFRDKLAMCSQDPPALEALFGLETLAALDVAYDPEAEPDSPLECRAVAFGARFATYPELAIALMQNLTDNDGVFKP